MNIIIETPSNLNDEIKIRLIDLVEKGGQVQRHHIENGIQRAEKIALLINGKHIISSAALKNPLNSYRESVFSRAQAKNSMTSNLPELGYIVTAPEFEGNGYCTKLLNEFFKSINDKSMFATTRKPSMIHILKKLGFIEIGQAYGENLQLLLYSERRLLKSSH